MPPRRVAPSLQLFSARELGSQVIRILVRIETEIVATNRSFGHLMHLDNGVNSVPTTYTESIAKIEAKSAQLVKYLEAIPGALMDKIFRATIDVYTEKYNRMDQGDDPFETVISCNFPSLGLRVLTLTRGVEAKLIAVLSTPTNSNDIYDNLANSCDNLLLSPAARSRPQNINQDYLPILKTVLSTLTTRNVTVLSFKELSLLGTVSSNMSPISVIDEFSSFLTCVLVKLPKLRSLTLCSPHVPNSLPQCSNSHLKVIGAHCPQLEFLDVSFNKSITAEGILHLAPDSDNNHPGCVHLKKLFIFDCGVFSKEFAKFVPLFPELVHLGYKETGKVLKILMKTVPPENLSSKSLKLTHVNNLGSMARRLIASAMRCKRPVAEAILNLCPEVENLKLRVSDDDLTHLSGLTRLTKIELVYHVGVIGSPGPGTQSFICLRGAQLSSIALICNTMTMGMLVTIAENCPNLSHLWSRSNHLTAPWDDCLSAQPHSHLMNLNTLYLRVGEGELSVSSLPEHVLFYLLKNARDLRELIVAVRSNIINDNYVQRLVTVCQLEKLQKILFVVPHRNSLPGILKLTINTVHTLMRLCPDLNKLGNILSWTVASEELAEVQSNINDENYDIEIVNKVMTMR